MSLRLRGASALVTGASSGIGAALAVRLAAAGCRPVLLGRDAARLEQVAQASGGRAVVADLATPSGLARGCELAAETDLLVNNAGRGWAGELSTMPADDLASLVAVNLEAPLRLTRAAVPAMRARGRGHVAFVASIAVVGVRDEAVYAATKAGLRAFAASLRYEVAADGVGVTTVLPGVVDTGFFHTRGRPYDRAVPRPIGADAVATALIRAVRRNRAEVFVPGWLGVAARLQGAVPATFHRLARRFG
jgi:short-subunit dehydrogenase